MTGVPASVCFSGGLDSAVLLADGAPRHDAVQPIYVSAGLAWEAAEARAIARLLAVAPFAGARRPRRDARASTCATSTRRRTGRSTGQPPAYDTPDEDVYLDGRNIVLLVEGGGVLRAARHRAPRARPARGQSVSRRDAGVLRRDGARAVARARPAARRSRRRSADLHKADVIRRGVELGVPLELTLSCMNPQAAIGTAAAAASAASGTTRFAKPACRSDRIR